MKNLSKSEIVYGFIVAVLIAMVMLPVYLRPLNYPTDDTYFYFQVAHNIVEGHGSSFNAGVTQTNGYHPLWMLFSLLSMALAGGNKYIAIYLAIAIQHILTLVTLCLVVKLYRRIRMRLDLLPIAAMVIYLMTGLYLSEAHINAFCVVLALSIFVTRLGPARTSFLQAWGLGLVAGLTVLARLDNIFFAFFLTLFFLYFHTKEQKAGFTFFFQTGASITLGILTVVAPYMLSNMYVFGHLMPISGAIKSSFPHFMIRLSALSLPGKLLVGMAVASLVVSGVSRKLDKAKRYVVLALSFSVLLHAFYLVTLTYHSTCWSWYYVLGVVNFVFSYGMIKGLMLDATERLSSRKLSRAISITCSMCGLILLLLAVGRGWFRYNNPEAIHVGNPLLLHNTIDDTRWTQRLAVWMDEHCEDESIIFVVDLPGQLAYFSDNRIVPTDGLMNDFRYDAELSDIGISNFVKRTGIDYWLLPIRTQTWRNELDIVMNDEGDCTVEVFAPLSRQSAGKFILNHRHLMMKIRTTLDRVDIPDWGLYRIAIEQ